MPNITVDIGVWCAECGAGLCHQTTERVHTHATTGFDVGVCEVCLDRVRDAAYDKGYNEGYEAATTELEEQADT